MAGPSGDRGIGSCSNLQAALETPSRPDGSELEFTLVSGQRGDGCKNVADGHGFSRCEILGETDFTATRAASAMLVAKKAAVGPSNSEFPTIFATSNNLAVPIWCPQVANRKCQPVARHIDPPQPGHDCVKEIAMTRLSAFALTLVCGAAMLFRSAALQGSQPAELGDKKPLVRMLEGVKCDGFGDSTVITTEEQLAKILGKEAYANVKNQVDFTKEKILWVTWAGSSTSWLTFSVKEVQGKLTVSVAIQTGNPATADNRPHGGMIVMPKDATCKFGHGAVDFAR
jgi:hypothetical protein